MGISVNGVDITDAKIERGLPHHQSAGNPLKESVHELILRRVLLQEADRLGIEGADDDARVEALFVQEVHVPNADDAACETFYRNHPQLFTSGEMVETRHILFQITPTVPLDLLRETGEAVLDELRVHPERFEELAAIFELSVWRTWRQSRTAVTWRDGAGIRGLRLPAQGR